MKYAQILNNKVHWIFESDIKPDFAPDIVIVDITENNEVQEGWNYNNKTGDFTPPEPQPTPEPHPTIDERLEVIEMTSAYTQLQVDYVAFLTEILATPQQ